MDADPTVAQAPFVDEAALQKKIRSGMSWFFWIAGLSVVNTVVQSAGSDRSFLVGLAATQVVDAFAKAFVQQGGPPALHYVAFAIDVAIAGLFLGFGALSRRHGWVYVAGLVVYALDGLIAAAFRDWPMTAFHVFALVNLVGGFLALRKLRAAASPAPPAPRPNPLVR